MSDERGQGCLKGNFFHRQDPAKISSTTTIFFRWDKDLVKSKGWASLSLSAKAVFPVIAAHCNKAGFCWPSQRIIAELAGYTEKTVREGIKGLKKVSFAGINTKKISGNGSIWPITYYFLQLPKLGKKGYFPFHKSLIDNKKWSRLTHSAQALYPAMRCFGYNDGYGRKYRPHDYCDKDKKDLAEYAGISVRSIDSALRSLERNKLVVPVPKHSAWRVLVE